MAATTNPDFGAATEATEVAATYPTAIKGKTILITGVNKSGVGYSTAEAFASQGPLNLIFGGRTLSKLQESIDKLKPKYPSVNYHPLVVDLSSQASVRSAAKELLSWNDVPKLDIIVNNAGIMNVPSRTLTADNIESQFATNHIGHFLLTSLLMPKVLAAAATNPKGATRIVNVSSNSMFGGGVRFSDINFTKPQSQLPAEEQHDVSFMQMANGAFDPATDTYTPGGAYTQSKSANVLLGVALTQRLYAHHGVLSVAVHPGVIMTELARYTTPEGMERIKGFLEKGMFSLRSREAGAATSLVAATDPALGPSVTRDGKEGWGAFLMDCQISEAPAFAVGIEPAEKLWKLSEELVGETFNWKAKPMI